jgi:hypothetical protein
MPRSNPDANNILTDGESCKKPRTRSRLGQSVISVICATKPPALSVRSGRRADTPLASSDACFVRKASGLSESVAGSTTAPGASPYRGQAKPLEWLRSSFPKRWVESVAQTIVQG